MKAAKGSISLLLFLAITWPNGTFASTQSLLDPYASIPAPSSKPAADSKKRAKKPAVAKNTSNRPTLTARKEEQDSKVKNASKPASVKPQATIVKNVPSADSGIKSGIAEIKDGYVKTFKAAGNNIVNGAKAVGAKIADGAHKVRATVVPDTKSAGDQISKGVGGIGHSVAAVGSKVKAVASSLGGKIAGTPKLLAQSLKKSTPSAKTEELEPTLPAKAASKKFKDESDFPGKPLEPLSDKPLAKDKSPVNIANHTLSKLNPFAHAKNDSLPQPVVLSDLRQSLPD